MIRIRQRVGARRTGSIDSKTVYVQQVPVAWRPRRCSATCPSETRRWIDVAFLIHVDMRLGR